MKQHATPNQADSLSNKGKKELLKWWKPRDWDLVDGKNGFIGTWGEYLAEKREALPGYERNSFLPPKSWDLSVFKMECIPLLSIGQMIEILGNDYIHELHDFDDINDLCDYTKAKDVCDSLWYEVKEKLEK